MKRVHKGRPIAFFDGPSGSQMVQSAIDASVSYLTNSNANLGGKYPTSRESEKLVEQARQTVSDFLGTLPEEIAFGPNMTTLAFMVASALSKTWDKGDRIVVTEIDHRANVDPWILAAEEKGVEVVWIPLDLETLTLDIRDLDKQITSNTRLVAINHASNGLGTINDVSTIAQQAHKMGALVAVDAVHSAPHLFIDRDELGADILFCSSYKFFGPHQGIVAIRKELFENLNVLKVQPSPKNHPDKLETGTQNHEAIVAITASIKFIASLGNGETVREQIKSGFHLIEAYEEALAERLRSSLGELDDVILLQAEDYIRKTPTVAFRIIGREPSALCEYLSEEHSVFAGDGHFYAQTIGDLLDLTTNGGWVRTGMAPYTTIEEVDRLIKGVKDFLNS